jgi:hypothetical protein
MFGAAAYFELARKSSRGASLRRPPANSVAWFSQDQGRLHPSSWRVDNATSVVITSTRLIHFDTRHPHKSHGSRDHCTATWWTYAP